MQIVKDEVIDFSDWTVIEESDTGDGLRITFYEKEGENPMMNLDWDEDSRWKFLDEGVVADGLKRLMQELLGEKEAKELMENIKVVSADELEELDAELGEEAVNETLGLKRDCSGGGGNDRDE